MTLQQLEYIVAVDKHRHFVTAAQACGVTQPTLSSMIKSLENELDIVIFDRKSHPVKPTTLGAEIISKAKVVLFNAGQLQTIADEAKGVETGSISMGIIPTVSPYLMPGMVCGLKKRPGLVVKFSEAPTNRILEALKKAELDIAILATPLNDPELLEIPLYHEKFYAYVTPSDSLYSEDEIAPEQLPGENLWILREGHCFRNQISGFCDLARNHSAVYESGSIDTLLRVLDSIGGHTIIPQMHIDYLTENQKLNVRPIVSEPVADVDGIGGIAKFPAGAPTREISLVVRNDYVHERLLNILADIIKDVVPEQMIDSALKKFPVRLF